MILINNGANMYCKSYRLIDGRPKWVIVDENGKIINKNQSKEKFKGLQIENRKNKSTCDRCKRDFNDIGYGHPCRERDEKGISTGRWLCTNCYNVHYDKRLDSRNSIKKSLRNHRTGNLNPNCSSWKGYLFEELTCRWRGVKNLNKENDNYNSPIDHSKDPKLGIIQTKGSLLQTRTVYKYDMQIWGFSNINREYFKEFDNMILYCADIDGKIIERIYIIPKQELIKSNSIQIYKNIKKWIPWYEEYRVNEEIVKKVNEIFQNLQNNMRKISY